MTGVPQAMASIITNPNGSGHLIGKSPGKERLFRVVIYLTDELDLPAVDLGRYLLVEIPIFGARDFSSDPKGHSCSKSDANCIFGPFFGSQAPKKGQVRSIRK